VERKLGNVKRNVQESKAWRIEVLQGEWKWCRELHWHAVKPWSLCLDRNNKTSRLKEHLYARKGLIRHSERSVSCGYMT